MSGLSLLLGAVVLTNAFLDVRIEDDGAVRVADRAAGRVWTTLADARTTRLASRPDVKGSWRLEGRELVFTLEGRVEGAFSPVYYPAPFAAVRGERLLLPHGCGFAFDAGETDLGGIAGMEEMRFCTRDMKMGCWGHYAEHVSQSGAYVQDAGYLAIVETPEDAALDFRVRGNGCRAASPVWLPSKGAMGYARRIRYVFFEQAAPIALAARYRREMERRGYVRTFREKAARKPALAARYELLKGAPDVWYWEVDGDKAGFARELKRLGLENILFGTITRRDLNVWVTPEEVRALAKIPGVLVSEYDIYRDTMEPDMLPKIDAVRPHWPLEAWDRDDIVRKEDGSPQRGWKVALKEDPSKPVVGCALLCEAQANPYVRERVGKRLAEAPYSVRFLDVTGTSLGECWNPRHPLTRQESACCRRATFDVIGREFGLLCGAEDGLECFVPEVDYFEVNFSAARYRVDGGRYMWKTYEESPEIMKRAIDPATRVPFFEMVFHDCVASYWYWTDYNNRFEDTWWQRDLLNALSGTPPMYIFTRETFARQKARLAESVKVTTPVAKGTADATIVDWRWLTQDRLVQESRFSNGWRVIANFSESAYRTSEGIVVAPHEAQIRRPDVPPPELEGLVCDRSVSSAATGFFRLEQDERGVWRFVTPGGHGFFLAANNGPARMTGDHCPALGYSPYKRTLEAKYGADVARWAADVSTRLKDWRFNAISTWDPPAKGLVGDGLAAVRVVQLGKSFSPETPNSDSNLLDNVTFKGRFPNVFRDDFSDHCRRLAERFCGRERDNPWIVGWYTDNEITWRGAVKQDAGGVSGDARLGTGMYDAVSRLPPTHSGRRALDAFLAERGLKIGDAGVTVAVKQDFLRLVAERYYRITTSAIRAAAPHHLVLGCRFAGFRATPDIAWQEGGKWNDALSVNSYPPADLEQGYVKAGFSDDQRPIAAKLREVYKLARRPILITEWAYPAKDTKCPCKVGAGQRVPTQKERAAASELFAKTLIGEPEVVGYSHFRWVDQPALGRWKMTGGEDCNYGLVDERDEPYALLTEALTKVQDEIYALRRCIGTASPAVRPATTVPYPRFKAYSASRGGCWWKPRHEAKLTEIAVGGGRYDLVLIGDSITHYWEEKPYAQTSWAVLTNTCRTLNLGFAGDRTEHVLWRLDNGELDGYQAKCVVLMIGTNNSTSDCTSPWETVLGVQAILDRIRAKQPQARIVLTAIFPRGRGADDAHHAAAHRRNETTNAILRGLADGENVVWVDFRSRLAGVDGWTTKEVFPDRIHPSEAGYRIWTEEIHRVLDERATP